MHACSAEISLLLPLFCGLCVCVCLLVTTMSCAKMAEQIKMLLGLWTWVAPRNHVLGVGLDSPGGRGKFGGHFPVHCIRNIWHEPELFARARCMPSSSVGRVFGHQWLSRWLKFRRSRFKSR